MKRMEPGEVSQGGWYWAELGEEDQRHVEVVKVVGVKGDFEVWYMGAEEGLPAPIGDWAAYYGPLTPPELPPAQ